MILDKYEKIPLLDLVVYRENKYMTNVFRIEDNLPFVEKQYIGMVTMSVLFKTMCNDFDMMRRCLSFASSKNWRNRRG